MVLGVANCKKLDIRDIAIGGLLQCAEAVTLGMPFEVWKTRMGRFRSENSFQALRSIYGRSGVCGFWQGTSVKMLESASKGGILLFSKEGILSTCKNLYINETLSGFIAGAGGGICQTIVMGPCTFLVTCVVTDPNSKVNVLSKAKGTLIQKGIKGFYPGGTAIAFRQATNWASRQGITELFRNLIKKYKYKNNKSKYVSHENVPLSKKEEIFSGTVGGALSTWNQPFEVARVHMQAAANEYKKKETLPRVLYNICKTDGFLALYSGIFPRICLGVWQTLFMVTGAKMIKDKFLI